MPKLHQRQPVLNNRGVVISYERDPETFFYRELIPGTKSYRTRRIEDAKTLDDAVLKAIDLFTEFRSEPPPEARAPTAPKAIKGRLVIECLKDYLANREAKTRAKLLKASTVTREAQVLLNVVKPYLEAKEVATTKDIQASTFDDFPGWRMSSRDKGVTKLTLQVELIDIKKWIKNYLIPKKLVSRDVLDSEGLKPPKIRSSDLTANPAINEDDWNTIVTYIRKEWIPRSHQSLNYRSSWTRNMFWNWILIAKNSGSRPEELQKLRWKDVQYQEVPRFSKTKQLETIQELQQNNIPIDENDLEQYGMTTREIANIYLWSAKTGEPRVSSCNCVYVFNRWMNFTKEWNVKYDITTSIKPTDYVWACPYRDGQPISLPHLRRLWIEIREELQNELSGHIFSDKPYTLYSLRSTFIEDALLAGKDIFLVAKAAGHSVATLQKHYERVDPRRRAGELTEFKYGKKAKEKTSTPFD